MPNLPERKFVCRTCSTHGGDGNLKGKENLGGVDGKIILK
jgi:hypothetical protein